MLRTWVLDGLEAEEEHVGDLRVCAAPPHQGRHLALARADGGEPHGRRSSRRRSVRRCGGRGGGARGWPRRRGARLRVRRAPPPLARGQPALVAAAVGDERFPRAAGRPRSATALWREAEAVSGADVAGRPRMGPLKSSPSCALSATPSTATGCVADRRALVARWRWARRELRRDDGRRMNEPGLGSCSAVWTDAPSSHRLNHGSSAPAATRSARRSRTAGGRLPLAGDRAGLPGLGDSATGSPNSTD
jgi:hypothetical protein